MTRQPPTQGVSRTEYAYGRMAGENKYADFALVAAGGVFPATLGAWAYAAAYQPVTPAGLICNFNTYNNTVPGGALPSILGLPQGTNKNQRVGNGIQVYRIRIRGAIILGGATSQIRPENPPGVQVFCDRVRIIVYHDRQGNGAAPSINDILEYPYINSPMNMDKMHRFKFLKDKTYTHTQDFGYIAAQTGGVMSTASGAAVPTIPFKMSIRLKNLPVRYNGSTGALAELISDNIGVFLISEFTGGTGVSMQGRVYYKDH